MQAPEKAKPGRKPLADGYGKTARINIKIRPADKNAWLDAAAKSRLTLTQWIEMRCDLAIGKQPQVLA